MVPSNSSFSQITVPRNFIVTNTMRITVLVLLLIALAVYFVRKRQQGWTWTCPDDGVVNGNRNENVESASLLDNADSARGTLGIKNSKLNVPQTHASQRLEDLDVQDQTSKANRGGNRFVKERNIINIMHMKSMYCTSTMNGQCFVDLVATVYEL
ncbi:hypothetical protein CPB84DRAFT_378372 [Gymnopilus junonius]|uniref:Uncharacterized protein n=1 Tax=Gymnopilus junonius TaxID=109634 RepID=A0A9P5NCA6_GYMJU|nr:hypothetical protein CPB84DRAFT_378372 [Gymnopilus junonius]